MKNRLTLLVALIVVVFLLSYMFAFQVRYDEVAVLTTFDRATPPEYKDGQIDAEHPGSLKLNPGPYFKLPWPIQKVHSYPTRLQILEDQAEEKQTKDGFSVIVKSYVTWRIEDPHAFFVSLENIDKASKQLHSLLREVSGVIGKYRFDQMVNTDPEKLQLDQIEADALKTLSDRLSKTSPKYGIHIEHVGIRQIALPESTTSKVFERMKATRERLAAGARADGLARAAAIRAEANSAQKTILSFALRRAEAIRAQGDRKAAEYYSVFEKDEQFAIFLRQSDALKKILSHNTTFVIDSQDLKPEGIFSKLPAASDKK
ncbi:MAG: SPFH domain-containing protein [Planctomycetota bacterium]|nr:SPFH domain-containing protein [Planctomycetota bacterium]